MVLRISLLAVVIPFLLQVNIATNPPGTIVVPYETHPGCGRQLGIVPATLASGQAVHGNQPWIASIRYDGQHRCDGVLISPDWIVSTARCLNGVPLADIAITLGEHEQGRTEGTEQIRTVQRVVVHQQYLAGEGRDSNDIALAQLAQPVNMSSVFVNTVCMPRNRDHGQYVGNTNCWHAGWNPQVSPSLRQSVVGVRVLSHQVCAGFWGDQVNGDTHLCINDTDTITRRPRCEYGAGSPVICYDGDSRARFVGLLSFGDLTCGSRPYVYTRVAYYKHWIHYMTGLSFPI